MKKLMCLCLVMMIIAAFHPAYAADSITLSILNSVSITTDFGNPVNTFEDVDPITGIRANFADSGPLVKQGYISSRFGGFAKKETADEFFNWLNSCGGLIFETGGFDFASFLAAHFSLDAGSMSTDAETGVKTWSSLAMKPKPDLTFDDYDNTDRPHERKYFSCLDANFQYIQAFLQPPPNSVSCEDHRQFCNYPPCQEKIEEDDPASAGAKITVQEEKHEETVPNIYKNLAAIIADNLVNASPVIENQSGIEFNMKFEDRTPPRIEGCVDGDFPELGVDKPATSGDWYKVEGLKVIDNSGGKIGTGLLLGKIDASPLATWASEERWILEKPRVIESGGETDHIIMPNSCHGVMRYTVYAWDKNGNLNPGEPKIHEDDPENCYGLGNTVIGDVNVNFAGELIDKDLSKNPANAKGWPIKVEFRPEEDFDDAYVGELSTKLNSDFRRGQGFVNIRDNDLPNIVIRIESVKDGSRVFFPPVIPHGDPDFSIVQSTKYKSGAAPADMNVSDYVDFLGPPTAIPFLSSRIADGSQGMYFRIVDIFPSDVMQQSEKDLLLSKYKLQPDPEFIRNNFRLESYDQSDSKETDGSPELDILSFGKRNSFGKRVVAVLELPANKGMVQEDVEYLIDVWTDDNIKWATIDSSGQKLDNIIAIPTGVQSGELIVEIPNQLPRASYRVPLDNQESVNGKLRVVFREPTPDISGADENELINKKFPFIEVKATDYAGLERSIRLYLRITNENPNIRVLDRKHEQNR
ncbi:MAG: hypothetical protein ACD_39C01524G0002 [uncultured bacterium]|nr:MAG: hypothetical protein ACD_39C01524G0002 [uncultured bacterium]